MSDIIVGVTPLYCDEKESIWMLPGYMDMLAEAGLLPIILPARASDEEISRLDEFCSGYLFTGGHDVDPALYGENRSPKCGRTNADRDRLEEKLFRRAFDGDKPIFGICRGIQFINVMMGGTLYQDLPSQFHSAVEHHMSPPYNSAVHTVTIEGGLLGKIIPEKIIGVNSYHHQAVKELGASLRVEAVSEDGLIEGISCPGKRFVLAVQWHPEFSFRDDENSFSIVKAFAEAAERV